MLTVFQGFKYHGPAAQDFVIRNMHLVKECEVSLAAGAGLVAELGHADRPAVRLLDREAQDVPAIMRSCKVKRLMYEVARISLTQPRLPFLPGGEAGDLVNVPVEEGVRLRVGDVEQLAGLGHVAGDPLVHRHADLVVAATLQGRKVYYICNTGTFRLTFNGFDAQISLNF